VIVGSLLVLCEILVSKFRLDSSDIIRVDMQITNSGRGFRRVIDWLRGHRLALVSLVLISILLFPQTSQSQIIPSPCCAILSSGLGSIASAVTNVIGSGLNAIRMTMNSIEEFQRTIVWPQDLINRARTAVGSIQSIFNLIRALGQIAVDSATLPETTQLEQTLLSRTPSRINSVASEYAAVYSTVPPPGDAPPEVRDIIDVTDAVALAAMKRAIAVDAIADLELEAADRILEEVRAAAPGSAPIVEAGAAAWLVRANAYTQSALSELMRLRSIDLAGSGAELKLNAQQISQLRRNMGDALQRR
jgi:hypothetical protein